MSKQPTRLADFPIPRESTGQAEGASGTLPASAPVNSPPAPPSGSAAPSQTASLAPLPAPVPSGVPVVAPIPLPAQEPRKHVGARVRLSVAERLRTFMYVNREEQQEIVERALDEYLRARGF